MAEYQVRLDIFEGPLDLLLYLVRKDEVELYDLSLELLTRQYLDYLGAAEQLPDLDLAGDFIAMAAHLIYLKSRRLLPVDQQPPADDANDDDDPRWELIRQLIEYKKFKEAAGRLHVAELDAANLFPRQPADNPLDMLPDMDAAGAIALGEVGLLDLLNAFQRVLRRFETEKKAPEERTIFAENYTVSDKIETLRRLIGESRGKPIAFFALFADATSRVELVVTFLALLELVRLKALRIVQSAPFAEIEVTEREAPPPPPEPEPAPADAPEIVPDPAEAVSPDEDPA